MAEPVIGVRFEPSSGWLRVFVDEAFIEADTLEITRGVDGQRTLRIWVGDRVTEFTRAGMREGKAVASREPPGVERDISRYFDDGECD